MKGQIFSIREIFSFLIGILLIASVFTIFTQLLNDRIVEFSLKENLKNVVEQVRLGVTESMRFAEEGGEELNSTYKVELPKRLVDYSYSVNVVGNTVCAKIFDYEEVLTSCGTLNLPPGASSSGTFLSGTKLNIEIEKRPGVFNLVLTND
ncbi:MAG: hypothetical protein GOU97_01215 [Nanoarchaeota archaeon]|nr:hypothetical protein [Nanoarchaeota archaeon]